ncbi:hypothetical protein [Streptomyces sp. NPDC090025]|uniref:hypothetical protein n=1 Tax=Streptomyces sp. NPDC090025 TaxID=3365922 RepID=UPI0038365CD1
MEHYPDLVRLAHLILPPELGRHRRVLAAHALVQRGLGRADGGTDRSPGASIPGARSADGTAKDAAADTAATAHHWLRARLVRDALRPPMRVSKGVALPRMLGLRVFPRAGGTDELALDRALAAATPEARAALALTALEGLAPQAVVALLHGAGVTDPARAVALAERLRADGGPGVGELLLRPEFDPCTVHLRPTDLLRRRRRTRLAAVAAAAVLLVGTGAVAGALAGSSTSAAPDTAAAVLSAAALTPVQAPAGQWADTSHVDFSVWPARGDRAGDQALLRRASTAWAHDARDGGGRDGGGRPQLLYAGTVDGTAVVLLHTGHTLVRYTEPAASASGAGGSPAMARTTADEGNVVTAAAVVLTHTGDRTRYLLAPWIAQAATRDLRAPASAARPLRIAADGTTEPVTRSGPQGPGPAAATAPCTGATVLQLRSSSKIVEDHAFLLADLGGLVPAHLSWTPLPVPGDRARQPREAAGPLGLAAWAHSACSLAGLRDSGVRSVNRWEFAEQPLPGQAGRALWVCARADAWEGAGRVAVTLEVPGRVLPVTTVRDTAACGRFGQDILAGTYWSAPGGPRYFLAAGSRRVVGVTVTGAVRAGARGRVFAAPAGPPGTSTAPLRLTGTLPDGSTLPGWTTPVVEGGG